MVVSLSLVGSGWRSPCSWTARSFLPFLDTNTVLEPRYSPHPS
jgi:hypothetical protein